ncbi:MAG: hypothetical protein RLP97_29780 [Coleofasciculus chthonoplastes F2-STO-03]
MLRLEAGEAGGQNFYSLFPVPCSLFPIPYSLFPIPCSLSSPKHLFSNPYRVKPAPTFLNTQNVSLKVWR